MSTSILKTIMHILNIYTDEISDLKITIEPRIIVELSHTYTPIDPDTGEVFYIIDKDSAGDLTLECEMHFINNFLGSYEFVEIQGFLTKFIKKASTDEAYVEDIHKSSRIPFPNKKEPKVNARLCESTNKQNEQLPIPSHQNESLPTSFKPSIGITGNISNIIGKLKRYLKLTDEESFNTCAFMFTFGVRKYNINPHIESPTSTVTSKMFVFEIEENNGSFCMSLEYVKSKDYHMLASGEIDLKENPDLSK